LHSDPSLWPLPPPPRWLIRNFKQTNVSPGSGVLSLCHGSGTDAIAANLEGYDCLGIDMDKQMCEYAYARVMEFYNAEQKRASACKDGALSYSALVNYANTLSEQEQQALAQDKEMLVKILSHMGPTVLDPQSGFAKTEAERSIIWSTNQLHLR